MTCLLSIAIFADPEGVGTGSPSSWKKRDMAIDFPRYTGKEPLISKRAPRVQILLEGDP